MSHWRRRMCLRKRAFHTKDLAGVAIHEAVELARERGHEPVSLRAYRCLNCDQWHITHHTDDARLPSEWIVGRYVDPERGRA